jgi:hypothetical protein
MLHMTGRLFIYELPPIDFWQGWTPASHWPKAEDEPFTKYAEYGLDEQEAASDLSVARKLAKECGWEGDGEWRMAGLPRDDIAAPTYMLAVKQYNNGTTYVISPYELPWLSRYLELKVDRTNQDQFLS